MGHKSLGNNSVCEGSLNHKVPQCPCIPQQDCPSVSRREACWGIMETHLQHVMGERSEDGWSGCGTLATSFIALGAGIFDFYHSASMPCPFWASVCPHRQRGLDAVMSPLSVTPV